MRILSFISMFVSMNSLTGKIEEVKVEKKLSLIKVNVDGVKFSTIVIDTPDSVDYLMVGHSVQVIFKETEVIIGKGVEHNISLRNKMVGRISSIEKGSLLSKVNIDSNVGTIISIITTGSIESLNLQEGSEVTAMVKTNEIMLSPC